MPSGYVVDWSSAIFLTADRPSLVAAQMTIRRVGVMLLITPVGRNNCNNSNNNNGNNNNNNNYNYDYNDSNDYSDYSDYNDYNDNNDNNYDSDDNNNNTKLLVKILVITSATIIF